MSLNCTLQSAENGTFWGKRTICCSWDHLLLPQPSPNNRDVDVPTPTLLRQQKKRSGPESRRRPGRSPLGPQGAHRGPGIQTQNQEEVVGRRGIPISANGSVSAWTGPGQRVVWGPDFRPRQCFSGLAAQGVPGPCRRRGGKHLPASAPCQLGLSLGLWETDREMRTWAE